MRRHLLVPAYRRILDRHLRQIGAELRRQGIFRALAGEMLHHNIPHRGEIRLAHRLSRQGPDVIGSWGQRQLGDMVTEADSTLRMVALAERMMVVARQTFERRPGRHPQRLHCLLGTPRGARDQPLEGVGRMRICLEKAQHQLVFGDGAKGEDGKVHHQEILVGAPDIGRQPLSFDADHLDREASRRRDRVRMNVAGCRGQPCDHTIRGWAHEDTLPQFRRQIVVNRQRALQDGM